MATTAQSILLRVLTTLHDDEAVRWTVPELVRYLNDGQMEIATKRPDTVATQITRTLVAGARQTLPADAASLIDIPRNATGWQRPIRMTEMSLLDSVSRDWFRMNGTTEVVHFMYDLREPTVFHVYPPASDAAQVHVIYAKYPTLLTVPAEGAPLTAVTGTIALADKWANALADYILYRTYSKDAEFGGNVNFAGAYMTAFSTALGLELQSTTTVAPQIRKA